MISSDLIRGVLVLLLLWVTAVDRSRRYTRILLILFLCKLPLVNPIVHGDGVGYYAYVRAPLIEHSLDFARECQHANLPLRSGARLTAYTDTGFLVSLGC